MSVLDRAIYRVRQFLGEVWARPLSAEAVTEIQQLLTAQEWTLFERYSQSDQNHSYAVMKTLQGVGCQEAMLLKAALLHDIGKTKIPVHLWDRVAMVLGKVLAPNKVRTWGQGTPAGWRRPFVIKEKHPEWGAEMALHAGCSEDLVTLIRSHQDPPGMIQDAELGATLRQLQWADDQH